MSSLPCPPGCSCKKHSINIGRSVALIKAWSNGSFAGRNNRASDRDVQVKRSIALKRRWKEGCWDERKNRGSVGNAGFTGGNTGEDFAQILYPAGYVREFQVQWGGWRQFYKLDFAHPTAKVNIELDGPTHYTSPEEDKVRDERLRALGWKVIRIGHE